MKLLLSIQLQNTSETREQKLSYLFQMQDGKLKREPTQVNTVINHLATPTSLVR